MKLVIYIMIAFFIFINSYCYSPDEDTRIQAQVSSLIGHTHIPEITYRKLHSGIRTFLLHHADGHNHYFELTIDQVMYLELGIPVLVESSYIGIHNHKILLQLQDF